MFASTNTRKPALLCEDCYMAHHYADAAFIKAYKQCILRDIITPEISRKMCTCKYVSREDRDGRPLTYFPIDDPSLAHVNTKWPKPVWCGVLGLGDCWATAKLDGLQAVVGESPGGLKRGFSKLRLTGRKRSSTVTALKDNGASASASHEAGPEGSGAAGDAAATDGDIPLFFRKYAEKNPFGNVHMALRVGPLVIENGVSK